MRFVVPCFAAVSAVLLGCTGPAPPAPGTSQVHGELRLVPRVETGGAGAYGDRRLRDVELVDYSRPGFAVVYADAHSADDASRAGGEAAFTIRQSRIGVVLEPSHAAVGAGGRVVVRKAGESAHVLSHPAAGALFEIAPGERIELALPRAGEQRLYLLDAPAASSTVFAAPGPYVVVSSSGRYVLTDLAPGARVLHAWHPRLPPASRALDLQPDQSLELDLELGVGISKEAGHAE